MQTVLIFVPISLYQMHRVNVVFRRIWVHFCSVVGGLSKQSIYGIIDLYRVLALGLFRLVKHKLKLKPGRKTLNRGARGEGRRPGVRGGGAARAARPGGGRGGSNHTPQS